MRKSKEEFLECDLLATTSEGDAVELFLDTLLPFLLLGNDVFTKIIKKYNIISYSNAMKQKSVFFYFNILNLKATSP